MLLEALGRSPDPDMGLGFFVNFVEVCGSIESRYELFVRHPELLERLLLLFTGSELFSRGLVEAPHLLDAGLASPWDPESLAPPAMRDRWKRVSSGVEDPEEVLVALRRFRRLEELRVALAEISGWVAVPQAQRALTTLAELCLNTGLELAVELSAPPESRKGLPDFSILGLGSLATGEFSYHSDLDLVCVSSREGKPRTVRTLFRQLHRVLSAHLDGGPLYKVDWRLRPEGKEGPLVVSFDHYRTYLRERLDIWERVALLKSRCVAGDATLAGELEKLVRQAAYDTGLPAGWLAEMDHIRQRMEKEIGQEHLDRWHLKVGAGALADIEFGVRYLQLVHGRARPELRQIDLPGALRALQQGGVVEQEEGEFLSEALQFLRVLAHRSRFLFGPEGEIVPREGLAVAKLVFLMQRLGEWGPGKPWETRYGEVTSRVRQWYRKVVEGLS